MVEAQSPSKRLGTERNRMGLLNLCQFSKGVVMVQDEKLLDLWYLWIDLGGEA